MIDPLTIKTLAIAMGLMLVGAAGHKWAIRRRFSAVVADYGLLPGFLVPIVAVTIPLLEITLGLAWLSGIFTTAVAQLTATMFLVYTLAIGINLLRGRVYISCGCGLAGAAGDNQPLSWFLVYRNVLLASLALLPLAPQATRPLGLLDGFAMAAALLTATLLWLAVAQLLRNRSAIRAWRNTHV